MTTNQPRREFVHTNDKYNLTHICMGFDEPIDSSALLAKLRTELPKATNEKVKDTDIFVYSVKDKAFYSQAKDIKGMPVMGHSGPAEHINVEFRTDLSVKTCLTLCDWICRNVPGMRDMALTGYLCYYPKHMTDDDDSPINDFIKVQMMTITYWHTDAFIQMIRLPFWYFDYLKEEFCDADEEWVQSHVDQMATLLLTTGKENDNFRFYVATEEEHQSDPITVGEFRALSYPVKVDKMHLCVTMTAKSASRFERIFDKEPWIHQIGRVEAEPVEYIDGPVTDDSSAFIYLDVYDEDGWDPGDRMRLIDWFLHEFDVKRLSGEGYTFVEPKIEQGHAEMRVETYDYEKGYNMFGSAVFNCIDPNYVKRAGIYGETCVCQLVGDALADMARFTAASATAHILARPPRD